METNLTIRNCAASFRFQCPKLWEKLSPTESPTVRHCSCCDRDVHYCTTDEQTIEHAKAGHCIAREIPELAVNGPAEGDLLVIGWGGTYGSIVTAVQRAQRKGHKVAQAHLRYLNPMPRNTGDVLKRYKKVLVPELNAGQLLMLLRSQFLVDAVGLNKIQGRPFLVSEIERKIDEILAKG